eukprot:576401-Rhodomonas_salina.2
MRAPASGGAVDLWGGAVDLWGGQGRHFGELGAAQVRGHEGRVRRQQDQQGYPRRPRCVAVRLLLRVRDARSGLMTRAGARRREDDGPRTVGADREAARQRNRRQRRRQGRLHLWARRVDGLSC